MLIQCAYGKSVLLRGNILGQSDVTQSHIATTFSGVYPLDVSYIFT